MGIKDKSHPRDFPRSDDSSFILEDFDDDIEFHVDPHTVLRVSSSSVEVHSPSYSLDETFSL